jgi:DNA polymerase-1
MKKLILVDVSAMYFRAFYAIRQLSNSKGMPTNALYGFISMTAKLLEKFQPEYLAFCFDRKDPSFRKELYDGYKANRSEMPEELKPQVPYIEKIAQAMGAPCFSIQGYEADDIIGMFAKFGVEQGLQVVIVSGDKDFAQLINEHVHMYEPMKDTYYDPKEVKEKWGVEPDKFRDYLAITGDSSDNIPGVKGIGPKGAIKLMDEYGSLEGIYQNLDKIANKNLQTKLIEHKAEAFLSQKLVTIVTENHTGVSELSQLVRREFHKEDLRALLTELEFNSFLKKLVPDENATTQEEKPKKKTATKVEAPKIVLEGLNGKLPVLDNSVLEAYSIEATFIDAKDLESKLDPDVDVWTYNWNNYLCFGQGLKLYILQESEYHLPFLDGDKWKWKGFDVKSVWRKLQLTDANAHFDLQLAIYTYSSQTTETYLEVIRKAFSEPNLVLEDVGKSFAALLILEPILLDLMKTTKTQEVFETVELPMVAILHKMETRGILLDTELLKKQSQELEIDIQRLNKEVQTELESTINLDSPKQLANLLFEVKKMPVIKKTKTGYSTDSDVLEKLSKEYPVTAKIIEYRELKKLATTYVDALPRLVNAKTKRLHTHFNQTVAATGRLSSTNPNLQNIPIRTEKGNAIREAFVASPGHVLVSADYSQIELRILAHITEDPALIRAFNEDVDIHSLTASEVFGVPLDKVDGEMRRKSKAINFGIAYGMGAYTLAENLNIPRAESKQIIDTYFDRFKNVKLYMKNSIERAKEQGHVDSIFGRRRYVPEIFNKSQMIVKFGERIAINSPMQSSASDIVKKAMIAVDRLKYPMLLQVHDELIFEVKESEVEQATKEIKALMENVVTLNVPLKVNIGWAKSWKDAH